MNEIERDGGREADDDDDLCGLFTISADDYTSRTYQLYGLKPLSTKIPVSVLSSPAASTDFDDTGSVVWPVSVLLSQFVVNHYANAYRSTGRSPFVLELGAGVGLPSVSLLSLPTIDNEIPKPKVVATDGRDTYVVKDGVLQRNVGGEKGGEVRKVVWGNVQGERGTRSEATS